MTNRAISVGLIFALLALGRPAWADDHAAYAVPVRGDRSFHVDAAVFPGLWAETSVTYSRSEFTTFFGEVTNHFFTLAETLSYGVGNFEFVAIVPFHFHEAELEFVHIGARDTTRDEAFGNLHFSAKAVSDPLRVGDTTRFTAAVYAGIQAPTSSDKRFIEDEFHIDGALAGRFDFPAFSWQVTAEYVAAFDGATSAGTDGAYDRVLYGTQLLFSLSDRLLLRTEVTGQHFVFDSSWFTADAIVMEGGLDIHIGAPGDIVFRFTGGGGVTDEAVDMLINAGIVLTFGGES